MSLPSTLSSFRMVKSIANCSADRDVHVHTARTQPTLSYLLRQQVLYVLRLIKRSKGSLLLSAPAAASEEGGCKYVSATDMVTSPLIEDLAQPLLDAMGIAQLSGRPPVASESQGVDDSLDKNTDADPQASRTSATQVGRRLTTSPPTLQRASSSRAPQLIACYGASNEELQLQPGPHGNRFTLPTAATRHSGMLAPFSRSDVARLLESCPGPHMRMLLASLPLLPLAAIAEHDKVVAASSTPFPRPFLPELMQQLDEVWELEIQHWHATSSVHGEPQGTLLMEGRAHVKWFAWRQEDVGVPHSMPASTAAAASGAAIAAMCFDTPSSQTASDFQHCILHHLATKRPFVLPTMRPCVSIDSRDVGDACSYDEVVQFMTTDPYTQHYLQQQWENEVGRVPHMCDACARSLQPVSTTHTHMRASVVAWMKERRRQRPKSSAEEPSIANLFRKISLHERWGESPFEWMRQLNFLLRPQSRGGVSASASAWLEHRDGQRWQQSVASGSGKGSFVRSSSEVVPKHRAERAMEEGTGPHHPTAVPGSAAATSAEEMHRQVEMLKSDARKKAIGHIERAVNDRAAAVTISPGSLATNVDMFGGDSGIIFLPWCYYNEFLLRLSFFYAVPRGPRFTPPALLEFGGGAGNLGTRKLYLDLDPIFPYVMGFEDLYMLTRMCMRVLAKECLPYANDRDLEELLRCFVTVSPPKRCSPFRAKSRYVRARHDTFESLEGGRVAAAEEEGEERDDRRAGSGDEDDAKSMRSDAARSTSTSAAASEDPVDASTTFFRAGAHLIFENIVGHPSTFAFLHMAFVRGAEVLFGERQPPLNPWHGVFDAPSSLRMVYSHKAAYCTTCRRGPSRGGATGSVDECACRGTGRIDEGRPCLPAFIFRGPSSRAALDEEYMLFRDILTVESNVGLRTPTANRLHYILQLPPPQQASCLVCGHTPTFDVDGAVTQLRAWSEASRVELERVSEAPDQSGAAGKEVALVQAPNPVTTPVDCLRVTRTVLSHLCMAATDVAAKVACATNPYYTLTSASIRPALDCRPTPGLVVPRNHAELTSFMQERAAAAWSFETAQVMLNAFRSTPLMNKMLEAKRHLYASLDPDEPIGMAEAAVDSMLLKATRSMPKKSAVELADYMRRVRALHAFIYSPQGLNQIKEYAMYADCKVRAVVKEPCQRLMLQSDFVASHMYRVDFVSRYCTIQGRYHTSNNVVLLFLNNGCVTQACYSTRAQVGAFTLAPGAVTLDVRANSCCTQEGTRMTFNYCGKLVPYPSWLRKALFVDSSLASLGLSTPLSVLPEGGDVGVVGGGGSDETRQVRARLMGGLERAASTGSGRSALSARSARSAQSHDPDEEGDGMASVAGMTSSSVASASGPAAAAAVAAAASVDMSKPFFSVATQLPSLIGASNATVASPAAAPHTSVVPSPSASTSITGQKRSLALAQARQLLQRK